MDSADLAGVIVSLLVGGGLGGVIMTVMTGRRAARKIDAETDTLRAKTPAEVESIAVATAEKALTMSETTSAGLLAENIRLRAHVERLEALLESHRRRLETAERALSVARQEYNALEREMESFRQTDTGTR